MPRRRTKSQGIKSETQASVRTKTPTDVAARISSAVGKTRKGRDRLTRVTSPVKGIDTNSRQWNRYGP